MMKKSVNSFLAVATALLFLSSSVVLAQVYVDQWGKTSRGTAWPILNDSTTAAGYAGIGSGAPPTDWSTIRGGFSTIEASTDSAIIVSGQLEFIGGGCDNAYAHLRYALTYQDSVSLNYQYTDSAVWISTKMHYGYEFTPRSGTGNMANGTNGVGTVWVVNNGNWNSTNSNGGPAISAVKQSPRDAEMLAGVYDWAISVQPLGNGTNEVRWYMVEQNNRYWFGGITIDMTEVSTKFNGICFGFYNDLLATQVNLTGVQVDLGDPLEPPNGCWCAYYVEDWGFIGGRTGGWDFIPGEYIGNAGVAGEMPATGWVAIRGGFYDEIIPTVNRAFIIRGKIEFVGGGFEAASSFRFGIFYSDSAGTVQYINTDSSQWSGSEAHHSGYLFIPPSGSNGPAAWPGISQQVPFNQQGTCGAVVDDTWSSTDGANNYVLGSSLQVPANAVAKAGSYNFAISIDPQIYRYNSSEIRFKLVKDDSSYIFAGKVVDNHSPLTTDKFNCVAFALNTNDSTTGMYILDVTLDMGEPIDIPTNIKTVSKDLTPADYALNQNYPNPFNPITQIKYSIPVQGPISLKVYNILGQEVATLFAGVQQPGNYMFTFNGTNLASGVYLYQLKANDFVKTNKMVMLK